MRRKITTNTFIEQACKIHNHLYDYSKVDYTGCFNKICIIDPEFGEFYQTPNMHLSGNGNPIRANKNKRISTKEFINRANKIHNNLYNYSKTKYQGILNSVCIIDPEYGEFWQTPNDHLAGSGSLARKKEEKRQKTIERFLKKATKIHDNLYDYSNIEYKKSTEKICIIDPEYGEFWQTPTNHLRGHGCPVRFFAGKNLTHKDHIIPLAIIGSRLNSEINKKRPLYKFLNSKVNIRQIPGQENNKKSDWIEYNGERIKARSVKNDYIIIAYLIENVLGVDSTNIIKKDRKYLANLGSC